MRTPTRQILTVGLLAGSLWAFSEVVLGAILRTYFLPIRGTLLTGIGVGILFGAFGAFRHVRTVAVAVFTAGLARVVFASSVGAGVSITNGSVAVMLMGAWTILSLWLIKHLPEKNWIRGLIPATAILCSGMFFYHIGIHYDPCPYLKKFTASQFFLREILFWSLLSGITAPLGYRAGHLLANHETRITKPLPAWGIIAGCWICCGLTVILSS